jgi:hypothetical protein
MSFTPLAVIVDVSIIPPISVSNFLISGFRIIGWASVAGEKSLLDWPDWLEKVERMIARSFLNVH